jgi:hypothetical protein
VMELLLSSQPQKDKMEVARRLIDPKHNMLKIPLSCFKKEL